MRSRDESMAMSLMALLRDLPASPDADQATPAFIGLHHATSWRVLPLRRAPDPARCRITDCRCVWSAGLTNDRNEANSRQRWAKSAYGRSWGRVAVATLRWPGRDGTKCGHGCAVASMRFHLPTL